MSVSLSAGACVTDWRRVWLGFCLAVGQGLLLGAPPGRQFEEPGEEEDDRNGHKVATIYEKLREGNKTTTNQIYKWYWWMINTRSASVCVVLPPTWVKTSRPRPAESTTTTVIRDCSRRAMKVFTPNTKAYRCILRLAAIWYLMGQRADHRKTPWGKLRS